MMRQETEGSAAGSSKQTVSSDYEYQTLMRLLGVSVSKHLLDEHFTLIWANEFYYKLIGWPKEEYEKIYHNRPDLYYENDPADWEELTEAVLKAVEEHKSGYQLLSRIRKKNGDHIWVQFSTQFSDEYIDGCQVAYSVLTNVDDLVRMEREQSVTYESLPGFVAKYRIEGNLELTLLGEIHASWSILEPTSAGRTPCISKIFRIIWRISWSRRNICWPVNRFILSCA